MSMMSRIMFIRYFHVRSVSMHSPINVFGDTYSGVGQNIFASLSNDFEYVFSCENMSSN